MEESQKNNGKIFEATQFHYENAGQFRAIAKLLGYSEKVEYGNITFSNGNEEYTYSMKALKAGNVTPERENILKQSKDRVINFFDKQEATNNFDEYSKYLQDNHNLAIVKWDDIKAELNTPSHNEHKDGFTIIDLEKKIAYTGEDLYKYAYEQNHVLNGKGASIDIPWENFRQIGVNPEDIKPEDIQSIKEGMKTGTMNFSIEDTPEHRKFLDKENVDYQAENGKLNFEGKATVLKYITADNTPENKAILRKNDIDFKEEDGGKKLKIDGINARKLAIAAITVVYPVAGIAIMLVPKRKEIKNDFSLSKDEIKALKSDAIVAKTNSKGEKVLFQRDKDTNEVVSVKVKDLSIPKKIGGIEMTPLQYEAFKNGHEVTLINEKLNKAAKVKLDLNSKNGISVKDANGIDISLKNESTPGTEKKQDASQNISGNQENAPTEKFVSDKERLEFIAQKGGKGIDEVFQEKPTEREAFLEKHNLAKDYITYKEVEKKFQNASVSNDNKTREDIFSQRDKIDATIKATANKEAALNGYGRVYGKSEENSSKLKI